MKKTNQIIIWTLLLLFGCSSKEDDKQKSVDMLTIRTLGLAYLEENKLAEAEAEFKKLIEIAPKEANGYANLALVYMRQAEYEKAEEQIEQALKLSPDDPDIRLNLAEIYELTGREDQGISLLEETLQRTADHTRSLYKLAQLYIRSGEPSDNRRAQELLNELVQLLPGNLPSRLELIVLELRDSKTDEALANMEEIQRQLPELPSESMQFFEEAIKEMQAGNSETALSQAMIFHNFMRATPLYQSGIQELKGPAGPLMGQPLLTFSQDISLQAQQEVILDAIRFNDASTGAGLDIVNEYIKSLPASDAGTLTVADFDRDRDQDFYMSFWIPGENRTATYLFRNDFGQFVDIASDAGIAHGGRDVDALFADYDNDGFLDLFVLNNQNNLLYANVELGKFRNVANSAQVSSAQNGTSAHFADFDHDSDLDLYITKDGQNQFFRYNGDKTYSDMSQRINVGRGESRSRNLVFGDFDEDGDLDFFVINENASNILYTNLRQGRFEDITAMAGLTNNGGSGAATVGDYNNDGFLDLFVTALTGGTYHLYMNNGDGTFEIDSRSGEMMQALKDVAGLNTRFFDFDNDGFLDILVVGKSNNQGKGVLLFHNDGTGKFEDASNLLPQDLKSGQNVAIFDYNEDGDLDFFIMTEDGRIRLLRNDGGNVNKYLKVQLVGIRTGSGKNNHFGIGSKIEVRAGDLYQIRVVNEPMTHFGLGQRLKADVVRILWPNGVPQNLFFAGSDQDLIEEQTLKGSCAFLYPWNGEKYEFVTDIMWRNALGMPLGIMGGETAYAFPNSSADYFKIPGEHLKEKDGVYSIQVTEELWETAFFDKVRLVAVDHPDSAEIFIDERFMPPPIPPLKIYTASNKRIPLSAKDENGTDVLPMIQKKDDVYVSNLTPAKYQGVTELHDLVLDLGEPASDKIILFLQGWVFPTDASINVALAQTDDFRVIFPYLQVINERGKWQTVVTNMSFPMGKNKTVVVDLTDKFLSNDYRVRIRTNMEIYWDHVFFTVNEPEVSYRETTLKPIYADLHYRGFSRLYRKGGRYGPHWFDYSDVSTGQKWRDLVGYYTRYGDVLPLLLESDNMYVILNAGDEVTVEFDAKEAPPLRPGWKRDFLIFGDGWIKDGDLNTAHGQTVEPLPYHGMTSYPYGPDDSYPTDARYQEYRQKYNTRKVGIEDFKNQIKPGQ